MNNMDYLDQITGAVQNRGKKKSGAKLLSPLMIKIIAVGAILFIVMLVVGGMLGSYAARPMELSKQLDVRMTNLTESMKTYNKVLKSPKLREDAGTLYRTLLDTTRDLGAYLLEESGFEVKKASGKWMSEEEEIIGKLNETLENARLNGILDDVYVREMNLQISLMVAMESEVAERTSDEKLKEIMNISEESLKSIKTNLDNL